ncbi:4-hydroxy-3-methylbut-2-en-1-yl diphosphate synthase [Eubacteriales bacterium OttesenSCG-928-A19]|nr:4-hydroxy-3-methylbut-2-en-1-yl diphosphate synthase [Eubacteriales bacterium OttesenSCG-928-A19]
MEKAERIRQRLRAGEHILGGHVFFNDPAITETMGFHGYEFVWIDAEHGAFPLDSIQLHISAAEAAGTASLVRVAANDPVLLKPVLDMGPDGIIVPMVLTAQEAEAFVQACAYPPHGIRGFGPRRANRYGAIDAKAYTQQAHRRTLRILQIEHIQAVENLEAILRVPGIDLIIVGPNDLSSSLGHLCDTRHPDMMPVYDRIARTCKAEGMPFGVSLGPSDMQSVREWLARGARLIGCGDDISYISMGMQKTLTDIRASIDSL